MDDLSELLRRFMTSGGTAGDAEGKFAAQIAPGGTIGDKRVPSFRAPALGNSVALDDEMRLSAFAQVLAHRQACLTAAHNERLHGYH